MGCLLLIILGALGWFGFVTPAATTVEPVFVPSPVPTQVSALAQLGDLTVSTQLDVNGCAVDSTTRLEAVNGFYVVLGESTIPARTELFVRLYRDGQPLEDSPALTADRDYQNTCVYFQFTQDDSEFEAGRYEALLFINGNTAEEIEFNIR